MRYIPSWWLPDNVVVLPPVSAEFSVIIPMDYDEFTRILEEWCVGVLEFFRTYRNLRVYLYARVYGIVVLPEKIIILRDNRPLYEEEVEELARSLAMVDF